MSEKEVKVSDFLLEFTEALHDQLEEDYKRWGSTWLKRTKSGQEERTRARFNDYFDAFENAGVPINWLKVVGGAMINWIREQHPELCPDIVAKFSSIQGDVACTCPDITEPTIKVLGHAGKCKEKIHPVAHVTREKITELGSGKLAYWTEPHIKSPGKLVMDSIKFSVQDVDNAGIVKVGKCDSKGTIELIPNRLGAEIRGHVAPNGQYTFTCLKGFLLSEQVFVSYDYEYDPIEREN